MTSHPRTVRALGALFFVAITAAPLFAAGKARQRAVLPPHAEKITISGTVTDAVSGAPLKDAVVTSAGMSAVTDAAGHYSLTCNLTSTATASRAGYLPVTKPVNGGQLDFALPRGPVVTVKTTAGDTIILDFNTTKFGYDDVFSYVSGEGINLCNGSNKAFTVSKNDLAKITGPAQPASVPSCCDRGPIVGINMTLKSGEQTTGYIVDSCFGLAYDILGVERSSATLKYIHLTDVSEITFP
jgi:hypothetical protein